MKQLGPGIYDDDAGTIHIFPEEIARHLDIPLYAVEPYVTDPEWLADCVAKADRRAGVTKPTRPVIEIRQARR